MSQSENALYINIPFCKTGLDLRQISNPEDQRRSVVMGATKVLTGVGGSEALDSVIIPILTPLHQTMLLKALLD